MLKLILCTIMIAMTAGSAVKIEKTPYQGWPNCYRISNGTVELIVTSDVGPRIMRYGFPGGQNLFKEFEKQLGKTGEKEYQLRGGHRVWVAPELLATTWALDNGPVKITVKGDVLEIRQPVDSAGIEKLISVKLASSGSAVEVRHEIRNTNAKAMEFAPWALTMMAPGGTAISGFPPRGKHPEVLLPTNPLVMWAYTDLSDKRWGFMKKYITLKQDPKNPVPQKLGMFNENTWGGYLLGSELFIKHTKALSGKPYPDFGCSYETFTNDEFLEIETLGPLTQVPSGATVEHIERWSLHKDIKLGWTEAEVDKIIRPLLAE